jgi:hypothetical protein
LVAPEAGAKVSLQVQQTGLWVYRLFAGMEVAKVKKMPTTVIYSCSSLFPVLRL